MTSSVPPHGGPGPGFDGAVAEAARSLGARTTDRWVEVAGDVLGALMRASRRSLPVLVQRDAGGSLYLSEHVLTARLREALDERLRDAAPARIHLDVSVDHGIRQVTLELVARHGVELLAVADEARVIVQETLRTLSPDVSPEVVVRPAHVHFGDVVPGDPRLSDPSDE